MSMTYSLINWILLYVIGCVAKNQGLTIQSANVKTRYFSLLRFSPMVFKPFISILQRLLANVSCFNWSCSLNNWRYTSKNPYISLMISIVCILDLSISLTGTLFGIFWLIFVVTCFRNSWLPTSSWSSRKQSEKSSWRKQFGGSTRFSGSTAIMCLDWIC